MVLLVGVRWATLPVLPVLDPSESRYAVVARDMLQSGDYLTPMVWANGEYVPFFSKPPLLFWLQAAAMSVGGVTEVAARMPPFLASLGVLLLTGWIATRVLSRELVAPTLLVLVSSPLFFLCAGLGLTDMLLCFSVSGALFSHLAFTRATDEDERRRWSLLSFLLLGVGMLAKGPVAVVQFGLPAFAWAAWRGRWTDLTGQAWWPGVVLFALPWVPWFLLLEREHPGFLQYFLVNENVLRFSAAEYGDRYGGGHKQFPGMAIVFLVLAMLPWFAVLGWRARSATVRARVWECVRREDLGFLVVAVGSNVAFLSFSRHLLGTYVLPVVPAGAVLLAAALAAAGLRPRRIGEIAVVLVVAYAGATFAALPIIDGRWSANGLMAEARVFQADRGAKGRIVFVEKRPFSARFYQRESVVDQIPYDAGEEHFRWYLDPQNGHALILREKHLQLLDASVTDRLRRVRDVGRFSIWEPVASRAPRTARLP